MTQSFSDLDDMTPEQRARLTLSLDQVKFGNTLSHDDSRNANGKMLKNIFNSYFVV